MHTLKRTWPIALGLLFALIIAGCGGAATSSPLGSGSSATTPPASAPLVKTASVSVKGAQTTVLTDSQGKTLYFFDPDTTTQATCTSSGGCAQTWPAFVTSSGAPAVPSGVSGSFSVINSGNGVQVTFNGHPLYTYSGDSGPGQANGDGLFGKWHVATPSTPQNANGSGSGGSSY